jgi:5'-3' exoribonuclease 1
VFQSDSRNESVIISIDDQYAGLAVEQIGQQTLGRITHAGWPYLQEAKIVAVSDEETKLYIDETSGAMSTIRQSPEQKEKWRKAAARLEHVYSKRFATLIHGVEVILHVRLLNGLKRLDDGALVKDWAEDVTEQAVQATVLQVAKEDPRYVEHPPMPIDQEFPLNSKVFYLGQGSYGTPAVVVGHEGDTLSIQTAVSLTSPNIDEIMTNPRNTVLPVGSQ